MRKQLTSIQTSLNLSQSHEVVVGPVKTCTPPLDQSLWLSPLVDLMTVADPAGPTPTRALGQPLAGDLDEVGQPPRNGAELLISSQEDSEQPETIVTCSDRHQSQDARLCVMVISMFDPSCVSVVTAVSREEEIVFQRDLERKQQLLQEWR